MDSCHNQSNARRIRLLGAVPPRYVPRSFIGKPAGQTKINFRISKIKGKNCALLKENSLNLEYCGFCESHRYQNGNPRKIDYTMLQILFERTSLKRIDECFKKQSN